MSVSNLSVLLLPMNFEIKLAKVVYRSTRLFVSWILGYVDNVMTKFMINNRKYKNPGKFYCCLTFRGHRDTFVTPLSRDKLNSKERYNKRPKQTPWCVKVFAMESP